MTPKILSIIMCLIIFPRPASFNFDKLIGNWKQVSGISLMPNKNQLLFEKTGESSYKGNLTVVESKKTIVYNMDFRYDSVKQQWRLLATRDKQSVEWWSSGSDDTIFFNARLQTNGETYYSRQGFMINEKDELIRIIEKSYDGVNFQGYEEKYEHVK